jgi:hypothetical protein
MIRSSHAAFLARVTVLALGATLVAACADTPTGTRLSPRNAGPLLDVSGEASRLSWYPNSIKYRDAGQKPATGRSGSATLTARALVDKGGTTQLEVTTGETLDALITPPGTLDHVQLKAFDPLGVHMWTTNDKPSAGGYVSYTLATLGRGSAVQVQANVRGIDAKRTDVVTIRETVKRRPDLAVRDVMIPERTVLGVPTRIAAVIQELNGDVGARADCEIRVDGVLMAAAHGMWVDAGDAVSCVFGVPFAQPGTRRVEIVASRVAPGDYDAANNVEVREIHVDETAVGFQFFAGARDVIESRSFREVFTSAYGPDETGFSQTFSDARNGDVKWVRQDAQMSGTLNRELPFPILGFSFFHSTDEKEIARMTYDISATQLTDDHIARMSCGNRIDMLPANLGLLASSVCSGVHKVGNAEIPFTSFFHHRFTTEVTYQAVTQNIEQTVVRPDGQREESKWTFNFLLDRPRSQPPYGTDYTIGVQFIAPFPTGAVAYSQTAVIPMRAVTYRLADVPYTCSDWEQPPYQRGQICSEITNWVSEGVEGFTNGVGIAQPMGVASSP